MLHHPIYKGIASKKIYWFFIFGCMFRFIYRCKFLVRGRRRLAVDIYPTNKIFVNKRSEIIKFAAYLADWVI